MKKSVLTILATAVVVLPLCAQRANTTYAAVLRADIPFEFIAQDTTMPPGKYVIKIGAEAVGAKAVVELISTDHKYYLLTNADSPFISSSKPKLIFHRYGNQYFLSQIGSASTNRDLPTARAERELKNEAVAAARRNQNETALRQAQPTKP